MNEGSASLDYYGFLDRKRNRFSDRVLSVDPSALDAHLFDFQRDATAWALEKGRAAIFADCGLGKSLMELAWANYLVKLTGGNVLILMPLAVSYQMLREAGKFGIEAHRVSDGCAQPGINVTNYERLERFSAEDFVGAVADESSILKSFAGVRRREITVFMRKLPYRLLCTATAAPNDYTELGTSSEALGYLGHMDMLNRFFRNDKNNSAMGRYRGKATEWRLKGHAETPFWRWVCAWARAFRKPSDLGYADDGFILKPLTEERHTVKSRRPPTGKLFDTYAMTLEEQREVVRRTVAERCERAAELVQHGDPALVWCHLNEEGRTLARMIPDAVEVSGADSDEAKEQKLMAFANGDVRVLITKPKIGGWGLNFQHCAHVVMFPSHSYEQYYQAIRRCWRFGQQRPVHVDIVMTDSEQRVLDNLQDKSRAADVMFTRLVALMHEGQNIKSGDNFGNRGIVPKWL